MNNDAKQRVKLALIIVIMRIRYAHNYYYIVDFFHHLSSVDESAAVCRCLLWQGTFFDSVVMRARR